MFIRTKVILMKKISKDIYLIREELDSNVSIIIEEQLNILDKNYGVERDIDTDLGGYVLNFRK